MDVGDANWVDVVGRNQLMEAKTSKFKLLVCGNLPGADFAEISSCDFPLLYLRLIYVFDSKQLHPCAKISAGVMLGECVFIHSSPSTNTPKATGSFQTALLMWIKQFIRHSGETRSLFGIGWINRDQSFFFSPPSGIFVGAWTEERMLLVC